MAFLPKEITEIGDGLLKFWQFFVHFKQSPTALIYAKVFLVVFPSKSIK